VTYHAAHVGIASTKSPVDVQVRLARLKSKSVCGG